MAAMPISSALTGSCFVIGRPCSSSVPSSACSAPVMILMSVDLPAPFSPISPWTSPGRRSNDTPLSACTPPNDLLMFVSLSSASTEFVSASLYQHGAFVRSDGVQPRGPHTHTLLQTIIIPYCAGRQCFALFRPGEPAGEIAGRFEFAQLLQRFQQRHEQRLEHGTCADHPGRHTVDA